MPNRRWVCIARVVSASVLVGCSGTPGSSSGDSGGMVAIGGTAGAAGSQSTGGKPSTGGTSVGTILTGGSTAIGGTVGLGGSNATGGTNATGGRASTGGANATGGVNVTGGRASTGGSNAPGGANATGGRANTGGLTNTGGVRATGGNSMTGGRTSTGGATATGGTATIGGAKTTGGASGTGGSRPTGGAASTGGATATGTLPKGWLYTLGGKIYVADGNGSGTQWMGRGVNVDDIYLCGYNYTLWMTSPEQTLQTMMSGLLTNWKPTFIRVSLSMDSFPTVSSWLSNPAQFKTPMTNVINAIGTHPNVYVLVTLRTDASMVGPDEATQLPTDSTTTPDANAFPNGTDPLYVALVDSFANSNFVLFGISNEPGGNTFTNAKISAAMKHAVGVIRAEEDRLGVPHHVVSVQGNGWTSDISFYSTTPLTYDNVVYEVHGYPPATSSYTYSNIPVILGEYGSLTSSASFYADIESKQIPNLAWDFDSYSNCAPDLLTVNQSASNLVPTAWGTTVQNYLLAHAQ